MNAFRILNANGEALTMKELDAEAAAFWGKEVNPENYANPFPEVEVSENASDYEKIRVQNTNALNNALNWYDVIGLNIANQGNYTSGWQNVAYTLLVETLGQCLIHLHKDKPIKLAEFVGDDTVHLDERYETKLYFTINLYQPFVDLINHWMTKGYIPVKVEE